MFIITYDETNIGRYSQTVHSKFKWYSRLYVYNTNRIQWFSIGKYERLK